MSSAVVVQRVAKRLVDVEKRSGSEPGTALASVAARLRVAPGSLANVIRAPVKTIRGDIRDAIVAAGIADIARQIGQLEHERQLLLQMGASPNSDDMDIVENALAQARAALDRMRGG